MLFRSLHDADLTINAFAHQSEAQNLAFGGELSQVRLSNLHSAPPDFDSFSGSFHSFDPGGRISIAGSWTAEYGNTRDRFNAESSYSFDQLQTDSGHVLSGSGIVVRERIEQHDQFQHEPLLNWMNLFNFNDPMNVSETTRRFESYNDSFNGAMANQAIQHATEFNHQPSASVQVNWSLPTPQDQEILKRPPYQFLPPPQPPRPEPSVLGLGNQIDGSSPSVNGVLMPAHVSTNQPINVQTFLKD